MVVDREPVGPLLPQRGGALGDLVHVAGHAGLGDGLQRDVRVAVLAQDVELVARAVHVVLDVLSGGRDAVGEQLGEGFPVVGERLGGGQVAGVAGVEVGAGDQVEGDGHGVLAGDAALGEVPL